MTGRSGAAPALARRGDRGVIVAVEEIGAAGERRQILGLDPVEENQHRGIVRVVLCVAEPDRLARGIAVARRAMREKARLVVGPQNRVQVLDALGRGGAHDDSIALRPGALQEAGQGALERRRQQVIEADLGHGAPRAGLKKRSALRRSVPLKPIPCFLREHPI